jgi:hypothetical protein
VFFEKVWGINNKALEKDPELYYLAEKIFTDYSAAGCSVG